MNHKFLYSYSYEVTAYKKPFYKKNHNSSFSKVGVAELLCDIVKSFYIKLL